MCMKNTVVYLLLLLCTISAIGCRSRTFNNPVDTSVALQIPAGLVISALSESSVVLNWNPMQVDPAYTHAGAAIIIERSVDGIHYMKVDSAAADAATITLGDLYHVGVAYSFRIRLMADQNRSAYSTPASKTLTFDPPSDLTVSSITDTSALLQWNYASTFENGFLIERRSAGGNFVQVDSTPANIKSTTVPGVYQRNGTYEFRVRATSVYHKSGYSTVVPGSMIVGDSTLVFVAGGAFEMGSVLGNSNELPVHAVTVGSFYIDKVEITYEKWTAVRAWGLTHGYTDITVGQNGYNPGGPNNPVTGVNWYDVVKWCNARSEKDGLTPVYYMSGALTTAYRTGDVDLIAGAVQWTANGYRLPTEAEWEFAARGGTQTRNYFFSGGNTKEDVSWYRDNSQGTTHPIGTKSPNELGLYDMSGNVEEWCWDWMNAYMPGAHTDPRGSTGGIGRVLRGGTFNYSANIGDDLRVTYRDSGGPANRNTINVGFRCVEH